MCFHSLYTRFNSVDINNRIYLRAASFCMASGDNSDDGGFTQGLSHFLPNTTFLQPPGCPVCFYVQCSTCSQYLIE